MRILKLFLALGVLAALVVPAAAVPLRGGGVVFDMFNWEQSTTYSGGAEGQWYFKTTTSSITDAGGVIHTYGQNAAHTHLISELTVTTPVKGAADEDSWGLLLINTIRKGTIQKSPALDVIPQNPPYFTEGDGGKSLRGVFWGTAAAAVQYIADDLVLIFSSHVNFNIYEYAGGAPDPGTLDPAARITGTPGVFAGWSDGTGVLEAEGVSSWFRFQGYFQFGVPHGETTSYQVVTGGAWEPYLDETFWTAPNGANVTLRANWLISGLTYTPAGGSGIPWLNSSDLTKGNVRHTWTQTAPGIYSWADVISNWTRGFPNLADDVANLAINLAGAQTIYLNQAITIGTLNIGDTGGTCYATTLQNGTAGALTFDVSSGGAAINKTTTGNTAMDIISATITLNDNIVITNDATAAAGALVISGDIGESGGPRSLAKRGAGTLVLSGNNTYTGVTTVSGGKLVLSGNNVAATGGITISSGAVQFDTTTSINGGAFDVLNRTVTVNSGGAVLFGLAFGSGNIEAALANRIASESTGAIAADNYAATDFDFSAAGLISASLGAVGDVTYTGTLTPNGTTYRLGGSGGTLTYGSAIAGAGNSLVVSGPGTVVLPGANTYGGTTTVSSGTLRLGGSNSSAGTTTVSGGVLELASDNALASGALTLGGGTIKAYGAARSVSNTTVLTSSSVIGGSYDLEFTGLFTNSGGNWTLTNGLDDGKTLTITQVNLSNEDTARTLYVNGAGDTAIVGTVANGGAGAGSLTKSGTGTLTLSGANTYMGTTTVSGGTLRLVGSNSSVGATTVSGGVLELAGNSPLASGALNLNGGTVKAYGAGRSVSNATYLTYSSKVGGSYDLEFTGILTNSGGSRTLTNDLNAGKTLTLGQVNLSNDNTARTLYIDGPGDTRIVGTVANGGTGAGRLTKSGSGTLALSGNNTYTGVTTVSGGKLVLSGNNLVATGGITISGGTVQFDTTASINGGAYNVLNRNVTINSGGAVLFAPAFGAGNIQTALANRIASGSTGVIAADNYAATGFNFNTAGLTSASLGAVGDVTYTGTLTPNGTTYRLGGGGGTLTYGSAIAGAGNSLVVSGPGTVVLPGASTYGGATTVSSGTLRLGGSNSSAGTTTVSGGILELASASPLASGYLNLGGGAVKAYGAARTVSNATYLTYSSKVGGAYDLEFAGSFINYGGSRTLTNDLDVGKTLTLSQVSLSNDNTARTLYISGTGNTTIIGTVSNGGTGAGTLTKSGAGTLVLSGANTYTGTTTVSSGTLRLEGSNSSAGTTTVSGGVLELASDSPLASGYLNLGGGTVKAYGAARTVSNSSYLTYSSKVSGSYDLEFTGSFINSGGSRTLTNDLDAGKTLTLGQVSLSNDNTARTLYIAGAGATAIVGTVANGGTGAGSLYKSGTGTLVLSGDNTYSGTTTVSGGKLIVDNTSGSGTGSGSVVVSGGVLGGNGTISGTVTVQSGGALAPGTGVGTLSVGTAATPSGVTIAADSTYEWEFDGTAGDKVAIHGDLTLTSGWKLEIVDVGGVPAIGSKYDLFTYTVAFSGSMEGDVIASPAAWPTSRIFQDGLAKKVYLQFGCLGDTNDDFVVDAADYIALKRHIGQELGATLADGDFNGDGAVNYDDLQILIGSFGAGNGGAPVTPEPAAMSLLALGGLAVIRRRRK